MTKPIDSKPVRFSRGKKNFGKVKNHTLPWNQFGKVFETVPRSGETQHQFNKLTELEQRDLKSAEGYWFRSATEGEVRRRDTALPSDLISLDFDYATREFFAACRDGTLGVPWAYFIHTSRRHTPEKPRFRMVIPTATAIPNELYPAASRIVAFRIDPEMIHGDPVSFRPAQMMFMPTASKDGEYVYRLHDGEACDWQAELDVYGKTVADWRDVTKLPKGPNESALRETSAKAEDPTEKDGPVGWFCRAYDIPEAIDAFDLPYEPVDEQSGKPRYTYINGTTVNGAEVQDGGLFLYSHHGSDPASDQLLNSFDLVRIHKFGDLDKNFDKDGKRTNGEKRTPGDWPSFKAMKEFIEKDERYRSTRIEAMYDPGGIMADLPDEVAEEIEESDTDDVIARLVGDPPRDDLLADMLGETSKTHKTYNGVLVQLDQNGHPVVTRRRRRRGTPEKSWLNGLDVTEKGVIKNTPFNITMIVAHDIRVRDAIAFNEFEHRPVCVQPMKTKIGWTPDFEVEDELSGDPWQDHYDGNLRLILSGPRGEPSHGWGLNPTVRDIQEAVLINARANSFNPIRDALESFIHDGGVRAETLFIDYLGCPDTPYYRDTARKFLIAAVMRIYEPGAKFDFVPVLWGLQGVRKSTFIQTLAMGWDGELTADFANDQKLAEQMIGCWIMEVAELVSMTKSEVETAKAFFSQQKMTVRMAYGRNPTPFKRQTVFMGSTNNSDFLKDTTGNRRFWPVEVSVEEIDTDRLIDNLEQIWAEALILYRAMRAAQPYGDLPLYLMGESAETARHLQGRALRVSDVDLVVEVLEAYIREYDPGDDGKYLKDLGRRNFLTYRSIEAACQRENLRVPALNNIISQVISRIGWQLIDRYGGRTKIHGEKVTAYVPKPETIEKWKREKREADANPKPVKDDFDPETLI